LEDIQVSPNLKMKVLETKGHTDNHLVLFDEKSRYMIAGDHVVGFGSATLDPTCGDMGNYFRSTHLMISFNPSVIIPAHGNPNYKPVELLQTYIQHRLIRENAILEAYKAGKTTPSEIVEVVYKDVSKELWPVAQGNVILHLKKLREDGKISQ